MNLLLDAIKKHPQAPEAPAQPPAGDAAAHAESAPQPDRHAAGNLFAAKLPPPSVNGLHMPAPPLLIALGATLLLLIAGYIYLVSQVAPAGPVLAQAPVAPSMLAASAPALAADAEPPQPASAPSTSPEIIPLEAKQATPLPLPSPVRIARARNESVDPQLAAAYSAYRNNRLEEARQRYQELLLRDRNNGDALLGLATIAQQLGELPAAEQYYARVLLLDPRNAIAHAGLAALHADDDGNESRLKLLLREQPGASALHFALGNLYAEQGRWSEAQQAYFTAWSLAHDNAEFAYNLAVSLDHLGQDNTAVQYYRQALQLDASQRAGFDHAAVEHRIERLAPPTK